MIFTQTFCTSILRFLGRFRLNWGLSYLHAINPVQAYYSSNEASAPIKIRSCFALKTRLFAGWYMLELQIKLPTVRADVRIYSDEKYIGGNTSIRLPVYSGRKCKRLIYLCAGDELLFDLELSQHDFELQKFQLIRVTQEFARSRILRKLYLMHPRYTFRQNRARLTRMTSVIRSPLRLLRKVLLRSVLQNKDDDFHRFSLTTLWADYNAIFEGKEEVYPNWVSEFDIFTDKDRNVMQMNIQRLECQPLISIVMPVYNPRPIWLERAIESVRNQIYGNWELCIADDASTDPKICQMLMEYSQLDSRIKVVYREQNGHISVASNSALALAKGEWIALLDHDDLLAEHALYWIVDALNLHQSVRLIYSDVDKIDESGLRSEPYFKCDWNLELFYSQNMISHLGVYQASLINEIGGFRAGFEGSQDYDLALRCIEKITSNQIHHIPRVLYHWRIHSSSTAHDIDSKPYAMIAGVNALNEHFHRQNIKAKAEYLGCGYRVRYDLPDAVPLVSIVIPTKNKSELLQKCIESILAKTEYANYEIIIVDNGTDERKALSYLRKLGDSPKIRILKDLSTFNYSKLNNDAVKVASGEIIALLNNDVEIINNDWLDEMVSHALRSEVGVVGAKLYYSDDTIQHAGVILGVHGVAGHAHRFLQKGKGGYCGRANLIQSFSAVTGACMVVRKLVYQQVGGMNETDLAVACNDIDFCLKVREAGYRNIWTPYAELYHHESASRGFDDTPEKLARSAKEVAYMQARWGELIKNDPAYSPNLTLDYEDFSLAWPPRTFENSNHENFEQS